MEFRPGATVLNYRIVDKLGEGGMGVVWKAQDTTLDRSVAIKLLPEGFGDDPDRLARFEREAKSLAALNHPNVASLFGLHEAGTSTGSVRFITMEHVQGEDLSQRIARGALLVDEALPIAIGIAEALAAAHAQGIVHRDLKPANVLLDAEGTPKVLDFGLAKVADPIAEASGKSDPSASPTITSLGTVAGVLLGTAAYMSPEQARGKPVDRRADVWALGCILFECLTGKQPFKGETISDTLASVLKSEPDWDALPADTPPGLVRILRRCLAKNIRERFQDAGDLRYELERALDPPAAEESTVATPPWRFGVLGIALLLAGIALGAILRHVTIRSPVIEDSASRQRTVSEIFTAPGTVFGVRLVSLALSPDGSKLAFVASDEAGVQRLYVRSFPDDTVTALPGTEGAATPFWSPDGAQIGFHAASTLKSIGLRDAQPRTIAAAGGSGGTWNDAGIILTSSGFGDMPLEIDVESGTVTPLTVNVPANSYINGISFLPDGNHYLAQVAGYQASGDDGVYLGSLDSDETRLLFPVRTNAAYSAGHLVYHKGSQVVAQPLDPQSFEPQGDAFVIADPVFEISYPFHGFFTVATDRPRLVYLEGTGAGLQTELVWFDREGTPIERTGIVGDLYNPRLSKDGRRLLLDVSTPETEGDIWLFDLARGSSRRITDHPIDESRPVWSPDESTVYFFRLPDLYRFDLNGSEGPVAIHQNERTKSTHDVSIDGKLVFSEITDNGSDLWILDTTTGKTEPWVATGADEYTAMFSPDGEWLAYVSDESGRNEVYVERFPQRGERFQVSRNGGTNASWRGDGKELYFASLNQEIVAVPVDFDAANRPVGEPQTLFRPKLRRDLFYPHPDGQRFLVVLRLDPEIDRATLVDDWDHAPQAP